MNHKELDCWKEAINFVDKIYQITKEFPSDEKFGIISQLRRASVSIPSNIAEGAARNSDKEFIQFLYISLGSLSETETLLIIALKQEYLNAMKFEELNKQIEINRSLLLGLIRYLRKKL